MTEDSSKKHRIVVKLKCTAIFAEELRSALAKEFDVDICFLQQPRIQEALPEPLYDVDVIITLVLAAPAIYDLIKRIVPYSRGARRKGDSRLGKEPVGIRPADSGLPFLDVENATPEDIDEFVERLLESEE